MNDCARFGRTIPIGSKFLISYQESNKIKPLSPKQNNSAGPIANDSHRFRQSLDGNP